MMIRMLFLVKGIPRKKICIRMFRWRLQGQKSDSELESKPENVVVYLRLWDERAFKNFTRAQISTFTHSVKKTTELPCLGILKHGNYDLTIRWMYVLSTDTPPLSGPSQSDTRLTVARINRLFWRNGWNRSAHAPSQPKIPRCCRVWKPLKHRGTLKKNVLKLVGVF